MGASRTHAHEARPAYLELQEITPNHYHVLWRTPGIAGMPLPVVLKLPDDATNITEPVSQQLSDSRLERRIINTGAGGLAGKRIEFVGLQMTITDVLVRMKTLDGR